MQLLGKIQWVTVQNILEERHALTDEYFNNLVAFTDSIATFFKIYTPLNHDNQAVVYLLKEQSYVRELLPLQNESVILDKKRKQ